MQRYRPNFSTESSDEGQRVPEKELALSVVCRAVYDYTRGLAKLKRNHFRHAWERGETEGEAEDAHRFLLGKSPMSAFWFSAAGLHRVFTEQEVKQLPFGEVQFNELQFRS